MKKSIILVLLAIVMLFAFAACEITTNPPSNPDSSFVAVEPELKDNVYQVTKPGHLLYMAEHPDKDYKLKADIDMGGFLWTPIDNFTGTFSGNIGGDFNYTISNAQIKVAQGDTKVGFFRTITGTVKEVNFENITITGSGTFTGNMGIVAGQSDTQLKFMEIKNCSITTAVKDANVGLLVGKSTKDISLSSVSGSMKVTLSGGTSYIGGAVGCGEGKTASTEARVDLDVSGTGTAGAVGGILGNTNKAVRELNYGGILKVETDNAFAAGALVGELRDKSLRASFNNARSVIITGATAASDYVGIMADGTSVSDCWTRDLSNLESLIPAAELAMRQEAVDYMYKLCTIRWTPKVDMVLNETNDTSYYQVFTAGETYFGLPYAFKTGSVERMQYYLNEDGTVKDTVPATDFAGFFGSDCCDSVYWAWATQSAAIKFRWTENTICQNGTLPVGGYAVTSLNATKTICADNGQQKMYEAYAQTKIGDAVLWGPGHIRLVAENAYVYRNADGSINPNKSYLVTHEQGYDVDLQETRHTTCLVNAKYTFAELFSTGYIPLTIAAYTNGKADDLQYTVTNTDTTKTGIAKGLILSNYRINYLKLQITDASGTKVMDAFYSPNVRDVHIDQVELSVFQNEVNKLSLTAGQKYTYTVLLGYGNKEATVQTFEFTA